MIKLQTNDGKCSRWRQSSPSTPTSSTNSEMMAGYSNTTLPLPNIDGPMLEKILAWVEQHKNEPVVVEDDPDERRTDDVTQWDQDFFNVDREAVFNIITAANYLDMKALLQTGCQIIANIIKDLKTPEEIRKLFNIVNEFTKEEEEQKRREYDWVEEISLKRGLN